MIVDRRFRGTCCFHHQGWNELFIPDVGGCTYLWTVGRQSFYTLPPSSGMKWIIHPWWWRQHLPLKRRSTIILHGSTTQKTALNMGKDAVLVYGRIGSHAASCLGSEAPRYFMVRDKLTRSDSWRAHSTPRDSTNGGSGGILCNGCLRCDVMREHDLPRHSVRSLAAVPFVVCLEDCSRVERFGNTLDLQFPLKNFVCMYHFFRRSYSWRLHAKLCVLYVAATPASLSTGCMP
jgi:hypothetical protein